MENLNLLQDLENEHRLIEEIAGSLLFVAEKLQGEDKWKAALRVIKFCRNFEQKVHHAKEEEILFPAFAAVEIDIHSKPLYYLRQEHQESATMLNKAFSAVEEKNSAEFLGVSQEFCKATWKHIDKEDSVIFREAAQRLRGKNFMQLNEQLKNYYEKNRSTYQTLWQEGEELIRLHPPIDDLDDLVRSDGCLVCDHFNDGCQGVEREWWNEHEWEDFKARNQGE